MRTLETIVRRVEGKREAIFPRPSFGNAGLTVQQPSAASRLYRMRLVAREQDLPCPRHRTSEHSPVGEREAQLRCRSQISPASWMMP